MAESWTVTFAYVLFGFGAVLIVIGIVAILYLCYIESAEKKQAKDNAHLIGRYNQIRLAKQNQPNEKIFTQALGPYDLNPSDMPYANPAVLYEEAKPGRVFSIDSADSVITDSVPNSTPVPELDDDSGSVVVTDLDRNVEDRRSSVFLVSGDCKALSVPAVASPSKDGNTTFMYRTYRHEPLPDATEIEYSLPTTDNFQ